MLTLILSLEIPFADHDFPPAVNSEAIAISFEKKRKAPCFLSVAHFIPTTNPIASPTSPLKLSVKHVQADECQRVSRFGAPKLN